MCPINKLLEKFLHVKYEDEDYTIRDNKVHVKIFYEKKLSMINKRDEKVIKDRIKENVETIKNNSGGWMSFHFSIIVQVHFVFC